MEKLMLCESRHKLSLETLLPPVDGVKHLTWLLHSPCACFKDDVKASADWVRRMRVIAAEISQIYFAIYWIISNLKYGTWVRLHGEFMLNAY